MTIEIRVGTEKVRRVWCSECPTFKARQFLNQGSEQSTDWEYWCTHIVDFIANASDTDMEPGVVCSFPVAPAGMYVTNDQWFSWVKVELGEAQRGGTAMATLTYEPEFAQPLTVDCGLWVPGEGRRRFMDSFVAFMDAVDPDNVKQCPSIQTHGFKEQAEMDRYVELQMPHHISANKFSILAERCCLPCYRKTQGISSTGTTTSAPPPATGAPPPAAPPGAVRASAGTHSGVDTGMDKGLLGKSGLLGGSVNINIPPANPQSDHSLGRRARDLTNEQIAKAVTEMRRRSRYRA